MCTHYIDLMFDAIGKERFVKNTMERGRLVTKFIYNHDWVILKKYVSMNSFNHVQQDLLPTFLLVVVWYKRRMALDKFSIL